jgi:hypothetical protein
MPSEDPPQFLPNQRLKIAARLLGPQYSALRCIAFCMPCNIPPNQYSFSVFGFCWIEPPMLYTFPNYAVAVAWRSGRRMRSWENC